LLNKTPKEVRHEKEKGKVYALAFYLFGKVGELYEQGFLNGKTVLSVLQELYDNRSEIKPLRKKEYIEIERKIGGSVKVLINFKGKEDLRNWYSVLSTELKRGVWVAAHEKLLDNLQKIWYNILHQNQ
jgi:hypothetical protein